MEFLCNSANLMKKVITVKKILSVLLCAAMLTSLPSCSNKKTEPEPLRNRFGDTVITMAINDENWYYDWRLTALVNWFNREDNGYEVVLKNYYEYDLLNGENGQRNSVNQLAFDIMEGGIVDIVLSQTFGSGMSYNLELFDSLAEKGAFADLYTFMENDADVNRDTLLPNILSLYEIDGKLPIIPMSFSIDTVLCRTKHVGDKENWTFDDLIAAYKGLPEGCEMT